MAKRAYGGFSTLRTPQSRPILGSTQVENSAGGFSWQIDKWERFYRFLILGAEGGTYYIKEEKLVEENAQAMVECVAEDGSRALDLVEKVSFEGRAVKQDPTLFALAYIISHADVDTRRQAAYSLLGVARTGTMLFTFCEYALQFRSWGPVLRKAVSNWYLNHENLPLQLVKYRQRNNFTHKRLLNVSHVNPEYDGSNPTLTNLLRWAHGDMADVGDYSEMPRVITGYEKLRRLDTAEKSAPATAAGIIKHWRVPWEGVPSGLLKDPRVCEVLLEDMPVMATLRQLGKMTSVGVLKPGKWDAVEMVCDRLKGVKGARVHPMQVLFALKTYGSGKGFRGKLTWTPVEQILEALDNAFYLAFGNVESAGKTIVIGLDVSSSMDGSMIANSNITAREAATAMAMVTSAVEPRIVTLAFTDELIQFHIKPKQSLEGVIQSVRHLPFGGTDCALPILVAMQQEIPVDAFIIYTDNETWAGNIHPAQALKKYRNKWNNNAKLIVVGMTSNGFSIADPNDRDMLDVVGFDTSVPQLMSDFISS
jgi:60 kDa SS-A/Ro ribonucleoprotein